MPETFNMLKNKKIVFFYEDDKILEYVNTIKKTDKFIAIKAKISDLPTYDIIKYYVQTCKNQNTEYLKSIGDKKGVTHYERDFLISGKVSYRKLITIWTSKSFLVNEVISVDPYKTDCFAWVDVSISRLNINYVDSKFDKSKINTPGSKSIYMGKRLFGCGGFMISSKETWLKFIPIYARKMQELKDSNYCYDDETIMFNMYQDDPSLFKKLVGK
jgi:hypothetical protein